MHMKLFNLIGYRIIQGVMNLCVLIVDKNLQIMNMIHFKNVIHITITNITNTAPHQFSGEGLCYASRPIMLPQTHITKKNHRNDPPHIFHANEILRAVNEIQRNNFVNKRNFD